MLWFTLVLANIQIKVVVDSKLLGNNFKETRNIRNGVIVMAIVGEQDEADRLSDERKSKSPSDKEDTTLETKMKTAVR